MKYTINIGLHNNLDINPINHNFSNAVMHINNAKQTGYFDNYHIREMDGEYNGVAEPTIVLTFETKADITSIVPLIEKWCTNMSQICIAMQLKDNDGNTFGALIYNRDFRGHKSPFDIKYFLTND